MIHLTVATLVEKDGRYLLVEESPEGIPVYNQPAGHWEPGETLLEAAVRETLEETGWHVKLTGLIGIYQIEINQNTYLRHGFAAHAISKDPKAIIDSDIDAIHWMTYEQVSSCQQRHRSPLVQQLIDDYRQSSLQPLALFKHPL